MDHTHSNDGSPRNHRRATWALFALLGMAALLLWTQHRPHVLDALPYVLLLVCPLLPMFHGHGGHAHGPQPGDAGRETGPGTSS